MRITVSNFIKIGQTVAEITGFQNGGPAPSLIFEIQTTTDAEFLHTVTLNFEL